MTDVLLECTQILTPADHARHIPFSFMIEETYGALECTFDYSPKEVSLAESRPIIVAALPTFFPDDHPLPDPEAFSPLQNLLTVSVTYENSYVGCRHYQDPHQAWSISGIASSKGYRKQRILPGRWVFKVNVHSLCSNEVTMQLRVRGVRADELL